MSDTSYTPAILRQLIAVADHHMGETTEQMRARAAAEHKLVAWRDWLPQLLDGALEHPAPVTAAIELVYRIEAAGAFEHEAQNFEAWKAAARLIAPELRIVALRRLVLVAPSPADEPDASHDSGEFPKLCARGGQ